MVDEMTEIHHWGNYEEMSSPSRLQWNTEIFNNVESDVIMNSIKSTKLKKCFFNSNCQMNCITIKQEIEFLKYDNIMKDILKMIKYKDDVKDIVERGKLERDVNRINEQICSVPLPKLLEDKNSVEQFPIHRESKFMEGIWKEKPLQLTSESALNALSTCVSTVLAYAGFTETTAIPLQVLTEIAECYIERMLKLLKRNVEKEKHAGESGFCDIVDRTFHEMGIGSLKNLIMYYHKNILECKNQKIKSVKDELADCKDTIEKMKEEMRQLNNRNVILDDENLIPELHVTSLMGNEQLSHSFETGLRMLHTLENQQ